MCYRCPAKLAFLKNIVLLKGFDFVFLKKKKNTDHGLTVYLWKMPEISALRTQEAGSEAPIPGHCQL